MFVAQIRNKLTRQEEQMEDLLTSNVFGLWRYLSPDLGLRQLLETARGLSGQHPPLPPRITKAKLEFWPRLQGVTSTSTEPDVLVHLVGSDGQTRLFLIEAKYHSGKSSKAMEEGPLNDQLAREMLNLRLIARRQAIQDYGLIYVTHHMVLPREDLEEAITELEKKTCDASAEHFYWTSWRNLPEILSEARLSATSPIETTMLKDLGTILGRLDLTYYRGVTSQGWSLGDPLWLFKRPHIMFAWSPVFIPPYKLQAAPTTFVWSRGESIAKVTWRWNSG